MEWLVKLSDSFGKEISVTVSADNENGARSAAFARAGGKKTYDYHVISAEPVEKKKYIVEDTGI